MSSFNKSFEESFKTGQATGSQAALEAIREKIQANEEARQSGLIIDILEEKIVKSALSKAKNPTEAAEAANAVSSSLDALRKAKFPLKTTMMVAEMIAPDALSKNVAGRVLMAGRDGVRQVGEYGPNDKVFEENLTPEEIGARKAQEQKLFKPKEIENLSAFADSRDTIKEIRADLESLGIKDPSKFGNIEAETIDSDFGPISIPARFNLVGQYAKDPKYTGVKRKLERFFNNYRKVITGAQASYQELQSLRQAVGDFTDRPAVFFENLSSLEGEVNRMLENRLNVYEAVGRDTSKIRDMFKPRETATPVNKGKIAEGTIIENKQTGERRIYKAGQWQPLR